jgi:hypothetical protein
VAPKVISTASDLVTATDESSAAYYEAKLEALGIDVNELSFVEAVAATRTWHSEWQNSDERREERDAIAREREAEAKAKRLEALAKKRDSLVAAAKRDADRAAKRDAALAELREAGLL